MSLDAEITKAVTEAMRPVHDHLTTLNTRVVNLVTPVPVLAYKKQQAAQALSLSVKKLDEMIAAGKIRTVTLPTMSHKMIPAAEIDRLLDPEQWDPAPELKAAG